MKESSAGLLALGMMKKNTMFGPDALSRVPNPSKHPLGATGIEVTPVGYGATRSMEPMLVKVALDSGMNFIDTGRRYFNGQNEIMIGKAIEGRRHEVVIQSKISLRLREAGEKLKSPEVSQRIQTMMAESLHESLKALQTDYIDVMLMHGINSVDILQHETIIGFLEKAKKGGKIRAHGFSSHSNQVDLLKAENQNPFYDVAMVPYNHKGSYIHSQSGRFSEWDQPALEEQMKSALERGMGIVAMKTCSAGPYAPNDETQPSMEHALRWILNQKLVHTMAAAMGSLDEIEEDVRAMQEK